MRLILFSVIACSIAMYSCKKTSTKQDKPKVEDLTYKKLTQNKWQVVKAISGNINVWTIPGLVESCLKDDYYRFKKDSVLTSYDYINKCSGSPDSTISTWYFIDGNTQIIRGTFFNQTSDASIVNLTDSTAQFRTLYNGSDVDIYFKKIN